MGSRIVDVGCGSGEYAVPLAALGFRVTAIDSSSEMIAALEDSARAAKLHIDTILGDAAEILPALQPADGAISINGPVGYSADPRPLVAAIAGAVKAGAPLWLGLPRAAALEQLLKSPRRTLRALSAAKIPAVLEGQVGGETIRVYVRDPLKFARELSALVDVEDIFAEGLILHAPAPLDRLLGELPLLRRFGASSVIVARRKNS